MRRRSESRGGRLAALAIQIGRAAARPYVWMALLTCPLNATSLLAENQARFGVIEGDVGFLSQGATEWRVPQPGLPIEPGDQIRTAEDSRVELEMTENVIWVLQPDTQVVSERADHRSGRLYLTAGALLGKVDSQRVPIQQEWEFVTPAATIGVRGTEFSIQFSAKDGAHLAVYEGLVEMRAAETAEGTSPIQRIPAGQEGVARRGKPLDIHKGFSPSVKPLLHQRADLQMRMARHQQGWSYWNPKDREELRKKIVPAPKKSKPRPRPVDRRRKPSSQRNLP